MARIVIIAILAGALGLWALACILRRLWETELVQSRVLRWTGHSYYVPTSWMHDRPTTRSGTRHDHPVALLVTFAAAWGSLVGSLSAGTRRTPARASAPAAHSLPGESVAGSIARRLSSFAPVGTVYPGHHTSLAGVHADLSRSGQVGPNVRLDAPSESADTAALPHPRSGQGGPQLTAAAQGPRHRAAAVSHQAGTS